MQSLHELCFSGSETVIRQNACWDALWASIWSLFETIWKANPALECFLRNPKWLPKRAPWGVLEAYKNDFFFSVASQDISRIDFGRYLDPWGLDFGTFFAWILVAKLKPNRCSSLSLLFMSPRRRTALSLYFGSF